MSALFKEVLTYDPAGQIAAQTWKHRSGSVQQQSYRYDSLARLVSWSGSDDTTTYSYDHVGNRIASTRFAAGLGPTYFTDASKYSPLLHQDRLEQRHRIDPTRHCWTDFLALRLAVTHSRKYVQQWSKTRAR